MIRPERIIGIQPTNVGNVLFKYPSMRVDVVAVAVAVDVTAETVGGGREGGFECARPWDTVIVTAVRSDYYLTLV